MPEEDSKSEEELSRMSFGSHLEELRRRLWWSIASLGVGFAGAMAFYEPLIKIMVRPHRKAMELIGKTGPESNLMSGDYTAPFFATVKMAFIVGLFVASPIIAYQIWAFISAGLYKKERSVVKYFAIPSFLLFSGGCVFGYFVLIPYGLLGLTQIQVSEFVDAKMLFSPYLNLVMLLTIVMGVVFEVPLLMIFFARIGLVESESYEKWRRVAILVMFILAAFLTPPDVVTQLIMVGPLIILYEIGIWVSRWVAPTEPGRKK